MLLIVSRSETLLVPVSVQSFRVKGVLVHFWVRQVCVCVSSIREIITNNKLTNYKFKLKQLSE